MAAKVNKKDFVRKLEGTYVDWALLGKVLHAFICSDPSYNTDGLFSKWSVVDAPSTEEEVMYILQDIHSSMYSTPRVSEMSMRSRERFVETTLKLAIADTLYSSDLTVRMDIEPEEVYETEARLLEIDVNTVIQHLVELEMQTQVTKPIYESSIDTIAEVLDTQRALNKLIKKLETKND